MKDLMYNMEEQWQEGSLQKKAILWDDKMRACQTESACGIRSL